MLNIPIFSKNRLFSQAFVLLFSTALGMLASLIASILVARLLGPLLYGDFKFIQIIWTFMAILLNFGFFHGASRVIVLEDKEKNIREAIGATLFIAMILGALFTVVTLLIAKPIDMLFRVNLSSYFISLSPLLFVFSVQNALILILQANNMIEMLSFFSLFPQLSYLLSIIVLLKIGSNSISLVLLAQLLSGLITLILIVQKIRPSLTNLKCWLRTIAIQNREYGIEVYKGSLGALASTQLNRLAVSYWVDNTAVGYIALAIAMTEPLKLIPNAVANASFRNFANQTRIKKRILLGTIIITLLCLLLSIIFYKNFLHILYPVGFGAVGPMAISISFGAVFHGFGDIFNRFLGAHGKGQILKNTAYLVCLVNIVGIIILTPKFGAWGAVVTTILAGIAYFCFMSINYVKYVKEIKI